MDTTIVLHKSNVETFLERFEALNRKLAKKNLPPVEYFTSFSDWNDCVTITLRSSFTQTNIKGVDVKFEGVVDLIEQDQNSKVFKLNNPKLNHFLKDCECDECHKKIGRNKYIVFSKKGKEVESRNDIFVLGTTCAKSYFPFNVESFIGFLGSDMEDFWQLDEYNCGGSSYMNKTVDFNTLYKAVSEVTDNLKVYEKDGVTRNAVENCVFDRKWRPLEPKIPFSDVCEWLKDRFSNIDNYDEFGMNIHSVVFDGDKIRERVYIKYIGIAIYSFIAAKKEHDKKLEKEAKEKMYRDSVKDEWFGNVGDKFEKELMFEKIIGFDGYYGYTYFVFFRDEDGRVFKWSTNKGTYQCWHKINGRDAYLEYEVGKKYLIKGSVKEHSEYKGIKQTVITRCKVLKDEYENHVFNPKDVIKEEKSVVESEDSFDSLMGSREQTA